MKEEEIRPKIIFDEYLRLAAIDSKKYFLKGLLYKIFGGIVFFFREISKILKKPAIYSLRQRLNEGLFVKPPSPASGSRCQMALHPGPPRLNG